MRESILTELAPIPRVEILHDTLSKNQILSPRCYGTKEKKHTPDLGGRVIELDGLFTSGFTGNCVTRDTIAMPEDVRVTLG